MFTVESSIKPTFHTKRFFSFFQVLPDGREVFKIYPVLFGENTKCIFARKNVYMTVGKGGEERKERLDFCTGGGRTCGHS